MSSELVATYSSLGTREDNEYFKGEECLACVKDLIRALRGDDESCSIRRHLGKAQILQTDLIPLLIHFNDDTTLRNDIIRLLVNLTQPAVLCFKEMSDNKDTTTMKCYIEVCQYLRLYKEEFAVERVMNVLGSILAELCQKSWDDRDDDDIIIIERILLLIRNVLHISSDPLEEKRTDDDVSIHDQILLNIHMNGIDELLLFLGSNPHESEWCMHVLEILFLLLREQSPQQLVRSGRRPQEERNKDESEIEELLVKEKSKQNKSQQLRGSRHSRFGGSYEVKPTLSGEKRVHHKPLSGVNDYSYDTNKRPLRVSKKKRPPAPPRKERFSTYSIRLILKEFCVQVLECCFNPLMRVVKDNIKRQRAMENDETYYLWAIRFFMEFSRLNQFRVDIISETLQLQTIHHVLQLIANYYENILMNKRDKHIAVEWTQRLHYAVKAYNELLLHIKEMTLSHDQVIKESSKVILGNILYHPEYRDVFIMLLRNYKQHLQPVTFLHDVILMTHIYIQLMESYCHNTNNILIQKKRKKKKSHKGNPCRGGRGELLREEEMSSKWDEIKQEVENQISNHLDVVAMDTSDTPLEEQKLQIMGRIYESLCNNDVINGISLMRAAREVWPNDVFGDDELSSEQELMTLKDIFFNPSSVLMLSRSLRDEDEEDNEEEEDEIQEYELEFDLTKYIGQFVNNKIVYAYSLVLSTYSTNSDQLNHAIIKMFHYIAVTHHMSPMLYHISLFCTLLSILNEPVVPRYNELQKFSRYLVSKFIDHTYRNPVLFVEVLFWKTSGECYEITEGYGVLERKREMAKNRSIWTREQEEELSELFQRFKDENDIVGCIEAAFPPDLGRTRRIIASQLVNQGLVGSKKELHKKTNKKKREWSEEEIFTLQSLWQPGEDVTDSIQQLIHYFPDHGVRGIKRQLKSLGLLPKKRNDIITQEPDIECDESEIINECVDDVISGTKGDIHCIVKKLTEQGYTSQLSWLQRYLCDEAEDRQIDSEWEEMCIVAIEENTAIVLQTQLFQDLLISIGLTPPSNQEMYWRIPKTLSPNQLIKTARQLTEDEDVSNHEEAPESSEKELSRNEALIKENSQTQKRTMHHISDKPSKVARIQFESDQSDEDDNRSEVGTVSDKYETDLKHKVRRRILSDSSDDDDVM